MTNTMANQITNLTKNEYTRSLFDSKGVSKSSFSKSSNIDFRLSSPFKIYNSYGANPVLAIDIISPHSQVSAILWITSQKFDKRFPKRITMPKIAKISAVMYPNFEPFLSPP